MTNHSSTPRFTPHASICFAVRSHYGIDFADSDLVVVNASGDVYIGSRYYGGYDWNTGRLRFDRADSPMAVVQIVEPPQYLVVDIDGAPTSDRRFSTYADAEAQVRRDWAAGRETYVGETYDADATHVENIEREDERLHVERLRNRGRS